MTKLKFDRITSSAIRCGVCSKSMPKGTKVYLIKPTDWRKVWAAYISGCVECAKKSATPDCPMSKTKGGAV